MADRFIKLYDKILKWEWYKNTNVKVLFLHLLLKANYKDLSFEGRKIQRGQLVTSLPSLVSELGMSVRQVRVSLDKLIMTGEVTSRSYPKYRVITIVHYDDYQAFDRQDDSQMTGKTAGKRQADDSQMTGKCQSNDSQMTASIESIEQIEDIEQVERIEKRGGSTRRFTPPSREQIEIFCLENGLTIDIDRFVNYYESNGWMVGRNHMKDWEATVRNWARRDEENRSPSRPAAKPPAPAKRVIAQNYEQRDYSGMDDDIMRRQSARIMARLQQEGGGD
jgi:hypothetical protein